MSLLITGEWIAKKSKYFLRTGAPFLSGRTISSIFTLPSRRFSKKATLAAGVSLFQASTSAAGTRLTDASIAAITVSPRCRAVSQVGLF